MYWVHMVSANPADAPCFGSDAFNRMKVFFFFLLLLRCREAIEVNDNRIGHCLLFVTMDETLTFKCHWYIVVFQ